MSAEMQPNFALITAERFLDTDSNTCNDCARLGCRNNFTYINKLSQEKMRGQRGRLRALAGKSHVHESYF